ncbi:protein STRICTOSIDINE SYNTHASE-LIKE 12-like [Syzygium oleosum]|uniref:protein STRICTOSIDINE SYNTHASE-LIKE 12-like n=1 Tax=Syzygium oleosum TaxID=219896 RepID=UPI0011D1EFF3|nr:protein STRICTOSIDINE SYNTHASE-LIKE 12-like [Syzygium oleosum]
MAVIVASLKAATMMIGIAAFLLFALPPATAGPVYETLPLPQGTNGPESLAFDLFGSGPYTGISDGRIVKYVPLLGFTDFAFTAPTRNKTFCDGKNATVDATVGRICGRPLGIAFNATQFLFICDAYLGLFVASPLGGRATRLVSSAGGVAIRFCDGLDVDLNTGLVYFTDASTNYQLSNISQAISSRDRTGRLLRFDPRTNQVTVLARSLSGPAGVAVAANSSYVLVTQFINGTITKFHLTGPNANTAQTLLSGVTGADNIKRSERGDFTLTQNPRPFSLRALRINGDGAVLANVSIGGPYADVPSISEAQLVGLFTYIASLYANFVGKILGSGLSPINS